MNLENIVLGSENLPTSSVDFLSGKLYILGESRNMAGQGEVEITFATKGVKVDDLNMQPSPILRYEVEQFFGGRSIHTTNQNEQILVFTTTMQGDIDPEALLQRVKVALLERLAETTRKTREMHEAVCRELDEDI